MIRATNEDRDLVVGILISAFGDNTDGNSINYVIKPGRKRMQRMRVLMGFLFDNAMDFGEVYLSDNKKCCILLGFSFQKRVTIGYIVRHLNLVLKCIGISRIALVLKRQQVIKKYLPKEDYIRPIIFGVQKEYKGGNTAGKLALEVFKKYRDTKLPVILDTVTEYNIKLYQKFNFRPYGKDCSLGYPIYFLRLN